MAGPDNVISLQQGKQDVLNRSVQNRRLLTRCRDITVKHMRRIMQGMFDNADDALFKLAENAGKGTDQNLYFDSMRIVRLQRNTIEKCFFNKLAGNFDQLIDNKAQPESDKANPDIDYAALSLVSEDDLEITLARERLEQKINSLYTAELSAINKRIAHLHGDTSFAPEKIPLSAESLVSAYVRATEQSNLMLEVQIILLKLFDLHCIHGLAGLYHEINNMFIEAGILPVIKSSFKRSEHGQASAPVMPQAGLPTAPSAPAGYGYAGGQPGGGENVWGTIQNLLTQQRSSSPYYSGYAASGLPGGGVGGGSGVGGAGGVAGVGAASVFSTTELLGPLTDLQQDIEGGMPQGGAHAVGNYVRVQLQALAEEGQRPRQLNPLDNDLIDVVCLIFEYILDDPQLPNAARASIGRLQIPMLKVALLDKSFFAMHGHPARDLLNLLARSALAIDEADSDNPILDEIDAVVQRVLLEFDDDIKLFSELYEDFNEFLQATQDEERNALSEIEQRQREREEMALARAWVRETLEEHLLGKELPAVVADIILGPWKDVMLHTYLQEGEQSLLWKTQIRFIDVLCWSIEPKQLRLDKTKLGNIIQQLVKTLREGLVQIEYPQAEIEAIFAHLEPYHLACIRNRTHGDAPAASPLASAMATIESEYADMLQEETGASAEPVDMSDKVVLEDIVLEGWEADPMLDAINDEYLDLARHLDMGKWVEFKTDKGDSRRAKLAWKSDLLGEYTFLNWKFDVVADKTLLELAEDLRQGKARVVEDVPLMDRALSAVLSSLTPKAK